MIELNTLTYLLMAVGGVISLTATYLAVLESNLIKAVVFSALQSTVYVVLFYLLMAPDIALVYIPVSVGLYPAVILFLTKKTEKVESDSKEVLASED
ncbi:MAG: hydrogenase subunit MbhD domain-containing protein [Desulfurococcaceae archaeon TW002]